jgi:hypothetical protein
MGTNSEHNHETLTRAGVDIARGLAAGGVLLSAAVHLNLWDVEQYRSIPTIGPLFLLNAIGGCVIGLGMLAWRHWLPAVAAAGYGLTTVGAYWISVVHGLFGFKEFTSGSAQLLAQIAEYLAVGFGLLAAAGLWIARHDTTTVTRPATGDRPRSRRHHVVASRL